MKAIKLSEDSKAELAKFYAQSSISELAAEISKAWKPVYYGARPYLDAMFSLNSVDDNYGCDSGRMIVAYFLVNASGFRGDNAQLIKKELKKRSK